MGLLANRIVGDEEEKPEMEMMLTTAGRVVKLLTESSGAWLCDDCIASKLNLSRRQQANQITNALALSQEFSRGTGPCEGCGSIKKVIGSV